MRLFTRPLLSILFIACNPSPDPTQTPMMTADGGPSTDTPPNATKCTPAQNPTMHPGQTITADEVWTAAGSPHIVSNEINVRAHLTVEPCAVIQLVKNASINVQTKGLFETQGTTDHAVQIVPKTPGERWDELYVSTGGLIKLTHTIISGGGGNNSDGINLGMQGDLTGPLQQLIWIDHVRIEHSRGYGIATYQDGAFVDGSTGLWVTSSGEEMPERGYPIHMSGNAFSALPDGDYTGNVHDAIHVSDIVVRVDAVAHDRHVPYVLGGNGDIGHLRVGLNGSANTLTIEAGARFQFLKDTDFNVNGPAGLAIDGAQGKPVVLEWATQGQHWAGLRLYGPISASTHVQYAQVSGAGGDSLSTGTCNELVAGRDPNDGAIGFWAQPPGAIVQNTTISDSAGFGIMMSYDGAQVPMLDTNTFTNVAGCFQSWPPDSQHTCPKDPPCPR